ncbi:hypothetical protein M8998_14805 [Sphingobacterium sp. lm-10]|uniref:DUF6624 domain-containing protein n=1 Tax=Sphingobacterium sp. lm-10 TaxID=2944904 RepID=UPI0020219B37|nr:DUF6624 domain-containing protein [Sphingobacterium sp. lm-10]MCL7989217.1 hypothetical protein [Sphingobacterium sp. lm-10]
MKTVVLLFAFCLFRLTAVSQVTSFVIEEERLNKSLKDSLERIYESDQSVRMALVEARRSEKPSLYLDSLQHIIIETDRTNLKLVNLIIERHGWVGPTLVGIKGAQGLFLVVQHADLETQENYLPIIMEGEKQGQILSSNVAILLDRVAMRQGKKQKYGSQGFTDRESGKGYIYPILDLDNLDIHRQTMGLPPMKEYVKGWDVEKYRTDLPKIEEILRVQNVK